MKLKELLPLISETADLQIVVGPRRIFCSKYNRSDIIQIFGDYEIEEGGIVPYRYMSVNSINGMANEGIEIWAMPPMKGK